MGGLKGPLIGESEHFAIFHHDDAKYMSPLIGRFGEHHWHPGIGLCGCKQCKQTHLPSGECEDSRWLYEEVYCSVTTLRSVGLSRLFFPFPFYQCSEDQSVPLLHLRIAPITSVPPSLCSGFTMHRAHTRKPPLLTPRLGFYSNRPSSPSCSHRNYTVISRPSRYFDSFSRQTFRGGSGGRRGSRQ